MTTTKNVQRYRRKRLAVVTGEANGKIATRGAAAQKWADSEAAGLSSCLKCRGDRRVSIDDSVRVIVNLYPILFIAR